MVTLRRIGIATATLSLALGCRHDVSNSIPPGTAPSSGAFTEITGKLGLPAEPAPWPDGQYFTPEITPGGVALFDYDNDGDLDIYQVCHPAPGPWETASQVPAPNRLFQQQANGKFVDETEKAGLGDPGYGQGVAIGDVDNDGDLDVYVTNYGVNRFYRNGGDGTFIEATESAGLLTGEHWSSSAAFLDYDRDGDLDLYVVRFARFDPERRCPDSLGKLDYCGPHLFDGERDSLYQNQGDGTFSDVTAAAGIDDPPARGWGVVCADLNRDGWVDIYVANDEEPNQLWINRHDGTFIDEAMARGAAVNGMGHAEASMGVAAADLNADGVPELFSTHIAGEKNTLFLSAENMQFSDASARTGVAAPSIPMTGWGCGFFDYDHDGDLDLAVVNGRVSRGKLLAGAKLSDFWNAYAEPNQLFENDGSGKFADRKRQAGDFTAHIESTRGLAFGDLDGDGDIDLVSNSVDNTLRIYQNNAPPAGSNWLAVRAMTGKRDAYGAAVTVAIGERRMTRLADPAYSYLASNDPRAHFGLGPAKQVDAIEVLWPDGAREAFPGSPAGKVVLLKQGASKKLGPDRTRSTQPAP